MLKEVTVTTKPNIGCIIILMPNLTKLIIDIVLAFFQAQHFVLNNWYF